MYEQEERFHSKFSVYQVLDNQRKAMTEKVSSLTEREAKSKTLEELTYAFSNEFKVNIPVLDESTIKSAKREVDIELFQDRMRADYNFGSNLPKMVKGTEISISVPFIGDADFFRVHANSHTMDYPVGRISNNTIVFVQSGQSFEGSKVRAEFDTWLSAIKTHLNGIRRDIGNFNDTIKKDVLQEVKKRLSKFDEDNSVLDDLGF